MVCQEEKNVRNPRTQWRITIDPDQIVNANSLDPADGEYMTQRTARWRIPSW